MTKCIDNRCDIRVWVRLYTAAGWKGWDVGPGERMAIGAIDAQRIEGFAWERGEPEAWAPTFSSVLQGDCDHSTVVIAALFGPRLARSVKFVMACLAGPASHSERNDLELVEKLQSVVRVPRDNLWLALERQATPPMVTAMVANAASPNVALDGDVLIMYLGGHGGGCADGEWHLSTWDGTTSGHAVLDALSGTRAEVVLVVDSCSSGSMVVDLRRRFDRPEHREKAPPRVTVIASTGAGESACTRWRIVQMLIDHVVAKSRDPADALGRRVRDTLRTPFADQRARVAVFEQGVEREV
eukprot:TRINITY_DN40026_c0_g1_i2.p1 TRINITY_DN40026_c0_g1~~TRINITY_DN40026_c0_g1_i2.p1  ORF type:complete len:298 (+),score=83.26 TRINITY_DN40026_c0_g1_i2:83-976(+)